MPGGPVAGVGQAASTGFQTRLFSVFCRRVCGDGLFGAVISMSSAQTMISSQRQMFSASPHNSQSVALDDGFVIPCLLLGFGPVSNIANPSTKVANCERLAILATFKESQ
jgi:hypothetical protein